LGILESSFGGGAVVVVGVSESPSDCLRCEAVELGIDEGAVVPDFGDRAQIIQSSYPFLPELFDLLTKKIASIPNFQRTICLLPLNQCR